MNQRELTVRFRPLWRLLRGSNNEEKIAGLLLTSKMFGSKENLSDSQRENVLSKAVSAVSPRFILRMLVTSATADVTEGQIRAAAVNILSLVEMYPSILKTFLRHESVVINALIKVS